MNHLRAPIVRYGFAAVAVMAATLVSLQGGQGRSALLLAPQLYLLAVLSSGAFGGVSSGGLALVLSLIAGGVFVDYPYNIGGFGGTLWTALFHQAVFLVLSCGLLYILLQNRFLRERADNALLALSRREQELQTTLEALPVGIWFTDRDGRIISGNKAAKAIWGGIRYVGPNDFQEYRIFDGATHRPLSPENYPISQALAGTHVREQKVEIKTFDDKHRKLLISAAPLRSGEGGEVWGVVAINEDITMRESALREFRRAKNEAERANRAKDRFLAVLSHELRTPLTPVLMLAESLEKHADLPETLRGDARMIRRYIALEARLIDDLLDLTRIEKGKLRLQHQPVDLNSVLRSVVKMVQPQTQHKKIMLHTDLGAERAFVEADRPRIKQVIWNILGNAIKFTPAGGAIILTTRNVGEEIRITVEDTGIGVPVDALESIFTAFEQAKTEHRRFGGLGLGLAIAKSLAELHGGQISAQSKGCGKGAIFTLTLPATMKPNIKTHTPFKKTSPEAERLRILVVEDHEPTAFVLTRLLKKRGHLVHMAASVNEARSLDTQPIDLLVSDIGLPDGSGLDVVQHYRASNPDFKAIALSGFGMDNDVERSLLAGFDRHLTKPIDFETLQEAIRELFGKTGAV